MNFQALVERYRVEDPEAFRLSKCSTNETWHVKDKDQGHKFIEEGLSRLQELQGRLYAQNQWSILLLLQAMDAGGKDSTIKHVLSGINPQGCVVHSFKPPVGEELNHDFLWRSTRSLPERGAIGIFNRSYYEEVLVVRVHPENLSRQKLPPELITRNIWRERFEDINGYERYLARNGIIPVKIFLNISPREQLKRFLSRLDDPEKFWKFSLGDIQERSLWRQYMKAYEETIRHTSTSWARWHVVPADHKWFARLVVAEILIDTLKRLDLKYPSIEPGRKKEFQEVRRELMRQEKSGIRSKARRK